MSDQEVIAMLATTLQVIADKALAGFKDEVSESDALSDINNLARNTIAALEKRTLS